MAEGYRPPQQSAVNFYYPQHGQTLHHSRHQVRSRTPPNVRPAFGTDTPSPSRSPDSLSPGQNLYSMFSQSHRQGQHGRVNGGIGGQRIPMMYSYQHQSSQLQQQQLQHQHMQHHPTLQQDHNGHNANGPLLSHQSGYSSSLIPNSTPTFTPGNPQNSHPTASHEGQSQPVSDHWAEQLRIYKESDRAHITMTEQHAPLYYARLKAAENRPSETVNDPASMTQDGEAEERGRPTNSDGLIKRQEWHSMDLSGQGVRILAAPLFRFTFLTELYLASNKISQLPAAVGQLLQLRHLDVSFNQLTELPPELSMCVYMKYLLLFNNNVRILPNELGSLYHLEVLGIHGNPLDVSMKQEVVERGTKSLIHYLREQAPVPLPPVARSMLELQDGSSASEGRLRVLSYNILCDKYVNTERYGYTASAALSWDYRREQILQEIQAQDPDIVCLQEANTDSFKEFSLKLAYSDYQGVFWPKTRAKTMLEKDAKDVDGCATFYKGSKYTLLDKQLIDFANIAINRPDMKNQHDIFNRVMPRDNIAVVTFFENRLTGARFIVINTHIFWNPIYADVKLIQIAILLDNTSRLTEKYAGFPPFKDKKVSTIIADNADLECTTEPQELAPSKEYTSGTQLPLILCVDLNSTPESSVYELLSTGRLTPDHLELANYQYGHFTRDGIQHPFSLRSAYSLLNGTVDELTFTNYTPGFRGMIDHIWYSTNTLEVTALLGPVDPEYMKRVPGFPNYHFPSDHLALLAEFAFKGKKEKKCLPEPDFGPQWGERRN